MIAVMLKCLKKTIKHQSTFKVKNPSKDHLFISHAVAEPLFRKIYVCENNPENLLQQKQANILCMWLFNIHRVCI